MATTQTASAMLKEIAALETYSETTVSASSETVIRSFVPFRVEVMKTKIKIAFDRRHNGKSDGIVEMPLKPNARVLEHLLKSGLRVTSLDIDVPPHTLAELKDYLLLAARYEKLKLLA